MGVKIVNISGNGSYLDDSIIDYSYQEDAQSLNPANSDGGTSQVSFSVVAVGENKDGTKRPNTKLLLNNKMSLVDDALGSVEFQVKNISISDGVVANITGETVQSKFNVVKTAKPFPHQGSDYTLRAAIVYYCSLCGVAPIFDGTFGDELDLVEPTFMGWKDNVWTKLKQLCSGVSASRTDSVGIEMYISGGNLHFRKSMTAAVDLSETTKSQSINIETTESSKSIDVVNYNTYYAEDAVIFEDKTGGTTDFSSSYRASFSDSMQVEAGATLKKRFTINGTLEKVNQPECVSQITPLPYDGIVGKYVVVGNDNLPLQPAQWLAEGGSLTVALTDVPNEIEVTIVAPNVPQIPKASDPSKAGLAPYKIGIETSGDQDYPAIYITGTGVFHNRQTISFLTGSSDIITTVDESPTSVDNPFIWSEHDASVRGLYAAQEACGPVISVTQDVDTSVGFGQLVGSTQDLESMRFRVSSVSYSQDMVSVTSKAYTPFSLFNNGWTGKTIAEFNDVMLNATTYPNDAMSFNELSVIPLIESA